jgi:hypothetical protein
MINKFAVIATIFIAATATAQTKAVIWDTSTVTLTNVEIDTIHFSFDKKPYQRMTLVNFGSTAPLKAEKPGQAIYVPDTMVVIIDTTNVSGAAADSFRIGVAPRNPISGAIIMTDIVYIRAAAATFATLTDGLVLGVPRIRPWANAYSMLIWRGDLPSGSQRIRTAFVRKE